MDITDYFPDDFEKLANAEYKVLPNLEAGPGEDDEDAGYKMVDMLANDLALDSTELDLEGLNWGIKTEDFLRKLDDYLLISLG